MILVGNNNEKTKPTLKSDNFTDNFYSTIKIRKLCI